MSRVRQLCRMGRCATTCITGMERFCPPMKPAGTNEYETLLSCHSGLDPESQRRDIEKRIDILNDTFQHDKQRRFGTADGENGGIDEKRT